MCSDSPKSIRKFLVLVDDNPECEVAIYYASRRAQKTGGVVTMLYVIPPAEFQHWSGVGDVMMEEARDEAQSVLLRVAEDVKKVSGRMAELVIREGQPREEIQQLIIEDGSVSIVVLGAGMGKSGPGPIISAIATTGFREDMGVAPVPLTIVPGDLTREQIDAIT